ncbi:hypothetical protein MG293_004438 [Ovis ammon polii]|uniref:Uncharacterized protein n=1 Tax=Ovis ammon polii TaxID=230172 RepID=A0AAD4UCY2_OVIAM|nr:hypothetical protein MG293_004438 [Ovis ammon polii]
MPLELVAPCEPLATEEPVADKGPLASVQAHGISIELSAFNVSTSSCYSIFSEYSSKVLVTLFPENVFVWLPLGENSNQELHVEQAGQVISENVCVLKKGFHLQVSGSSFHNFNDVLEDNASWFEEFVVSEGRNRTRPR